MVNSQPDIHYCAGKETLRIPLPGNFNVGTACGGINPDELDGVAIVGNLLNDSFMDWFVDVAFAVFHAKAGSHLNVRFDELYSIFRNLQFNFIYAFFFINSSEILAMWLALFILYPHLMNKITAGLSRACTFP